MLRNRILGLGVVCGVLLVAAPTADAADQIIWGTRSGLRTGPLAGGSASTLVADSGFPTGATIDMAAGKIYWTSQNSGNIGSANLDGTGATTLFSSESEPIGGMGIDPGAGKLYWAAFGADSIRVGNLDGSGTAQTVFSGESGPIGVVVDKSAGKLYWADWGAGTIRVGSLDGSGTPQTLFSGESNPYGVAIDAGAGKIYWADQGAGTIRVGNLDGSGTPQTLFSGESAVSGLAVDPSAAKVYWGGLGAGEIRVGGFDGTGAQTLFSGEDAPVSPLLLRTPLGAGTPNISGAGTPGSTLSCSQGSWAPDRAEAYLFRSPRSYAYSWSRNGTLTGDTTNTLTATQAGSYTCTVTATNPAGNASQTSPPHQVMTSDTITTRVFDAATNRAWSGSEAAGARAYDTAVIGGRSGGPSPTGTVTYTLYANRDCTGTALSSGHVSLTGGMVPRSRSSAALQKGDYAYRAAYSGDSNYSSASGHCERFSVRAVARPVNGAAPKIIGTPRTGAVLSCSRGRWSGSPTRYRYQWYRNGDPIPGATRSSYRASGSDSSRHLSCRVTASNAGGSTSASSRSILIGSTQSPAHLHARIHARAIGSGCQLEQAARATVTQGQCLSARITLSGTISGQAQGGTLLITLQSVPGSNARGHTVRRRVRIGTGRWRAVITLPAGDYDPGVRWRYTVSYAGSSRLKAARVTGRFHIETETQNSSPT